MKEELYPRKKELDILEWWKINSSKYPVLSRIARDILAISASTVPSKFAFSSGERIVSDYRSSLSCSTVEALICQQDFLRTPDLERFKAASLEPVSQRKKIKWDRVPRPVCLRPRGLRLGRPRRGAPPRRLRKKPPREGRASRGPSPPGQALPRPPSIRLPREAFPGGRSYGVSRRAPRPAHG